MKVLNSLYSKAKAEADTEAEQEGKRSRRTADASQASCDITGTSLQRCRIMLGQNESERFFTSLWSPCQLDGVRAVIEAEGGEIPNTKNFHSTFHSNC